MNRSGKSRAGARARRAWIRWIGQVGAGSFYDAFVRTAQDAESRCAKCDLPIYLDVVEGGGVPDWRTRDGDYGCRHRGGSHRPLRLSRHRRAA